MISSDHTNVSTRGDVSFEEIDQYLQTKSRRVSSFTIGNSYRNSSSPIPIGTLLI